jgi:TPR repeat protein
MSKKWTWAAAFADALLGAKAGVAKYQTFAGYCLYYGIGVEKDKSKARSWFQRAASQGFPDASYNLALDAEDANVKNLTKAKRLYLQAAECGHLQAQANLAAILLESREANDNLRMGLYWLRIAARRGDARAQYNLGIAYLEGLNVRPSIRFARLWLERAATQGHLKAKRVLRAEQNQSATRK